MNLLKGKSARTRIFSLITVVILLVAICFTLFFNRVGQQNTLFLDLTYEGFYTLTERMAEECAFVEDLDEKIEIIFCNDPDRLISQEITRVVYYMSVMLDNKFENIDVTTVNVALNPTAVSEYKTTALNEIATDDVIISYKNRYRILNAETFWYKNSSGELFSYNGEYKMASIMKSLTAYSKAGNATAYFLTDHGETVYDGANPEKNAELRNFVFALEDAGLVVKTLDLSTVDRVPDDCALLIINNPTLDFEPDPTQQNSFYYVSPLEKLDRYLISDYGTLMVAKSHDKELPLLESFLYEWGFEFENALVKDEIKMGNEDDTAEPTLTTQLVGSYNTDENDYGMGVYSEFASLDSAPKYMVENSGFIKCSYGITDTVFENGAAGTTRVYSPFILSSATATAYKKDAGGVDRLYANAGVKDLIGVTTRMQLNPVTNENRYSYVICANSADFLSSSYNGNSAYSNYDILVALALNTTRADDYASIDLGGTSQNSSSFGGKMFISDDLSPTATDIYYKETSAPLKSVAGITTPEIVLYSIMIFLAPVALAVVGIVVKVKRKYL